MEPPLKLVLDFLWNKMVLKFVSKFFFSKKKRKKRKKRVPILQVLFYAFFLFQISKWAMLIPLKSFHHHKRRNLQFFCNSLENNRTLWTFFCYYKRGVLLGPTFYISNRAHTMWLIKKTSLNPVPNAQVRVCIWRYILQNYNYKLHFQNLSTYHISHVSIGTLAAENLDVCTACSQYVAY
jgi:hypothetical protein